MHLGGVLGPPSLHFPISKMGTVSTRRLVMQIKFDQICKLPDMEDIKFMSLTVITEWNNFASLTVFFFQAQTRKFTFAQKKQRVGKLFSPLGEKNLSSIVPFLHIFVLVYFTDQ